MDVSFSTGEIAIIVSLLLSVTGPLGLMFKMLISDRDRQIARLERQNEKLTEIAITQNRVNEATVTTLITQRG